MEAVVNLVEVKPHDARWEEIASAVAAEVTPRRGQGFAQRMERRLLGYSADHSAVAARRRNEWVGLILLTRTGQYGELSFPWVRADTEPDLAAQLIEQARARLTTDGAAHIIVERTIVAGEADPKAFAARGFQAFWRRLMARSLRNWRLTVTLPAGYRLGDWDPDWVTDVGQVIFEANQGTVDAVLYPRFFGGSVRQCTDALREILAGALGRIDPHATCVLVSGSRACGVCLVGVIGDQHGIIELAVAKEHQGRRLGRALMVHALSRLVEEGVERVVLAVSADNTRAVQLYDRLGFAETTQFPVCVWRANR